MIDTKELRALEAKATPGPWYGRPSFLTDTFQIHGERQVVVAGVSRGRDAEFIIASRNAIPALLDELDRLREEGEKLVGVLRAAREYSEKLGRVSPIRMSRALRACAGIEEDES